MGGVENKEAQARDGASPKFGSPPKEVLVCGDDPGFPKLAHDRAISWQQDAHVVSQLGQCAGKSPGNIRQPAGLDQRRAFRDDKRHEFLTSVPETIHPPDTIEEIAMPRRSFSSWINFAGGTLAL